MAFLRLPKSNYDKSLEGNEGFGKEIISLWARTSDSPVILNARKTRHTYRERPKGKLPFHSYIDSFIAISIHIKDTYRDHSLHFFIYLCFNYAYFLNLEFDTTYQAQDGRA